jgi:hypothetical protein
MDEVRKLTRDEWLAEGRELFGDNFFDWRFVCPGCGHVQSIGDFREHKDRGATPDAAAKECIGRYEEKPASWSEGEAKKGGPCDYAAYGLFFIGNTIVLDGDREIRVFDFDRSGKVSGASADSGRSVGPAS